jgi:serine/threonine protein kinase
MTILVTQGVTASPKATRTLLESPVVKKGVLLGPYRLTRRLATGGMAEIFLAQREGKEGFARELVVKRILPHLGADPEFRSMFRDEARLAALLSHPNVVHVYDFGSVDTDDGEQLYLAMELVRGVDLRALVIRATEQARIMGRPWPVPPHHAAKISSFVCEALAHAHDVKIEGQAARIVHRDVTPSNVMVSFEGAVKLADFGIAKAAQKGRDRTDHGVVKGKYTYLSPEQARGEALDGRSDLFNVGILLVEMLLGEPVFAPDEHRQAKRLSAEGKVPKLERLNKLPPALAAIARKALSAQREDRYPDALTMRADLETWLRSSPVPSDTVEIGRFVRELFPDALAEDARGARAAGTVPLTMALAALGTAPITAMPQLPGTADRIAPPMGLIDAPTIMDPLRTGFGVQTTPLSIEHQPSVTPIMRPLRRSRAPLYAGLGIIAVALLAGGYLVSTSGEPSVPTGPPGEPPRALATAPIAPAHLRIASDPAGLRIFVDGAEQGLSPLVAEVAGTAVHTIEARDAAGAVVASERVIADAGGTHDVALRAANVNATVRVSSRPAAAMVSLDGVEVGRAPLELAVVPGEHEIRLVLAGYREETEVVRLENAGETLSLTYALQVETAVAVSERPRGGGSSRRDRTGSGGAGGGSSASAATGMVIVGSTPDWALVYEGSRRLGPTPYRGAMSVGHHRLTLRSEEHGTRTVEVDVREGETARALVTW